MKEKQKTGMKADNLLRQLPPVGRSRDFHLYIAGGRRFLDLYLNGGRAYYGHRPGRLSQKLKSVLSKGTLSELPSIYERRVYRLARTVFPDFADFRIFRSADEGLHRCAAFFGSTGAAAAVYDSAADPAAYGPSGGIHGPTGCRRIRGSAGPAATANTAQGGPAASVKAAGGGRPAEGCTAAILRPDFYTEYRDTGVFLPLLPLAAGFFPALFCFTASLPEDALPAELFSPVLLAGLAEGLRGFRAVSSRAVADYPPLPFWKRRGRYLIASCDEDAYSEVYSVFLQNGILINPYYPGPSILPEYYSEGEWKLLEKISSFCYKKWKHGP